MAERDLVKTGIKGFDAILSDGIPRGNIVLLEGGIGTGKTTMGVEFVYRGVKEFGEPGIIVLFEVSPDRLVRDAGRLGWDKPAQKALRHCDRNRGSKFLWINTKISEAREGTGRIVCVES